MALYPDYVTSAELKSYVRISDLVDDTEVALAIAAASRAVDRACGRQFGVTDTVQSRFYTAEHDRSSGRWLIGIDDVMTQTGLSVDVDGAAITEFDLKPSNAAADGRPWTEILVKSSSATRPTSAADGVKVTATFGWTAVPTAIKQATLMQASRLLSRRDSPFGVAGSPEMGSELRLLAKLDPDVAVTIAPYRRFWGAA